MFDTEGTHFPSFAHGFTYSAHPVAAAALANLDIVEREDLVGNAKRAGATLKAALKRELGEQPLVGDIRGEGLMIGIEFVADRKTKRVFDPALKVPQRIVAAGYDEGVIFRPLANLIAMSPSLILSDDNIDELVSGLKRAFATVTDHVTTAQV